MRSPLIDLSGAFQELTAARLTKWLWTTLILLSATPVWSGQRQMLHGNVPETVTNLKLAPASRLPSSTNLDLVIGLPFRNQQQLEEELRQCYDPRDSNYHHYLTPAQFNERFGPTEQDYQRLLSFARSNNLAVVIMHSNRAPLHVRGSVGDIERTFHLTMRLYQHPTENRVFYAPDVEPSVDLEGPLLEISGLDNYRIPHARHPQPMLLQKNTRQAAGSGKDGNYSGRDFRPAYAPGVALRGSGQSVGIIAFDGYVLSDIRKYEDDAGLPYVPIQLVPIGGFTNIPSAIGPGNPLGNAEVSLDMEMVASMAPGIATLLVYGATGPGYSIDVLNEIAQPSQGEPLPSQISTSYELFYNDTQVYQALQRIARQGQTFFCAAGDSGAYTGGQGPFVPCDYPYVTCVGGTELTTSGPGGSWVSETAWSGGGGGPSPWYPPDTNFAIPQWQIGMDMSVNQGSTTTRNCPDVAMVADSVMVIHNDGVTNGLAGTSIASPLWAGFAALVNQQAVSLGHPTVGFMSPLLYAIGRGGSYASCFHDITAGDNAHGSDLVHYHAVQGYDLCTGWGTPAGQNLIDALAGLGAAVWVQYGLSDPGNGGYTRPYNTLAQGTNAVPLGGIIVFKYPGSTPEKPRLGKPMIMEAVGGPATIGR